jgi:hypothetical protein
MRRRDIERSIKRSLKGIEEQLERIKSSAISIDHDLFCHDGSISGLTAEPLDWFFERNRQYIVDSIFRKNSLSKRLREGLGA